LAASNSLGSDVKAQTGYVTVAPPPPIQTFLPSADARVNSGSPNSNYGSDSVLRARAGSPAYNSYLRFAVSGIGSQSVISAKLRVSATQSTTSGGSRSLVGSGWTENGITWNNAPAIGGTPLASAGAVDANQWVEYDVTSTVRGDGTYNFGLGTASTNSLYLSS